MPCSRRCPELAEAGTTLILNGDVPLVRRDTAQALIAGLQRRRSWCC
jgi:bifunctional N-acetylglucosamine-1-phosphate-uridyltransferase/glucosamine-1-phosphate-acetyltransferase GlmU-like protein